MNDLNGPLYILDRKTKKATAYLDFNGRGSRPGLFDKLVTENGLASGFISFDFDPDYARNGRFYTIHLEEISPRPVPIHRTTRACRVWTSAAIRPRRRFTRRPMPIMKPC